MKHIYLLIFSFLPAIIWAQKYEIGLNGGATINSKPYGNMYYKAEKLALNYSTDFSFLANMEHDLQIGLDLHVFELSRIANQKYANPTKDAVIGIDGRRFVYSKVTTAGYGILNKKLNTKNGYAYAGIAIGAALTINMDKTPNTNASYIAPNGGHGISTGLQVGYCYPISKNWALNAEAAFRDMNLDYDATAPVFKPYSTTL